MDKNSLIYVAGHNGLVGSAISRRLARDGYQRLLYASSSELDLTRQAEVKASSKSRGRIRFSGCREGGRHIRK